MESVGAAAAGHVLLGEGEHDGGRGLKGDRRLCVASRSRLYRRRSRYSCRGQAGEHVGGLSGPSGHAGPHAVQQVVLIASGTSVGGDGDLPVVQGTAGLYRRLWREPERRQYVDGVGGGTAVGVRTVTV